MSRNEELLFAAVAACSGRPFFYKFISANETGATGAHVSGFYIPKTCWHLFAQEPLRKGTNLTTEVTIHWQGDELISLSHAKYYGVGTRNECRLTRNGRGFPYLTDSHIGSMLVIVKTTDTEFAGFVIDDADDQDDFLAATGASVSAHGALIEKAVGPLSVIGQIGSAADESLFTSLFQGLQTELPDTDALGQEARDIARKLRHRDSVRDPDTALLDWYDTEWNLLQSFETSHYAKQLLNPFPSVTELLKVANAMLNSRKSRAGHALEHHLVQVFADNHISNSHCATTENRKKPDFLFPGIVQYKNPHYPVENLVVLAAKTTCKDRWRQILNEADRLRGRSHYLMTLQQGISAGQLLEMQSEHVIVVSPAQFHQYYPQEWRSSLMTLKEFLEQTRTTIAPDSMPAPGSKP